MTAPYRRILLDIEARIRSGDWAPGFRLPVEHELAATYGCARATVSKAMSALVAAGLIERRKKAGTFVAAPPVHATMLGIPDIGAVVAERGESYAFRLLDRAVAISSPEWAREAPTLAGKILRLNGVHLAGGRPLAVEHRELSLDAVPEAAGIDFGSLAPGSWLLGHIPWSAARHRVSAVNPDDLTARRLDIRPSQACLQVERWTWHGGRPITFARQIFPGDRYDLVGALAPAADEAPPGLRVAAGGG